MFFIGEEIKGDSVKEVSNGVAECLIFIKYFTF